MGTAEIYRNASICDSTTVYFANAHFGYRFDHWSNGNTNNPDTLLLTDNSTIIAYFVKDQFDVTGLAGAPVFYSDFNNQQDDSVWTLKNENYVNRWYIDNLEGDRALFVSNDGGLSNSYDGELSAVLAFRTLDLDSGHYLFSFDWRSIGNVCGIYSYDFGGDRLSVSIYPGDAADIPFLDEWWCHYYYDDILYYESSTSILSGHDDWSHYNAEIEIQSPEILSLLFYWLNTGQEPNGYPAAIDNVILGTLDTLRGYVLGAENIDYLDTATITAVANPGYRFVCWYDCDTNITKSVVVTGDLTCVAYFEAEQYSVVVNSSDTLLGTVSGGGVFEYSEECTITATPTEGYYFLRWSDGNTDNPRTITVTQDTILTAIFGTCTDVLVRDTVTSCESYTWGDSIYTQSGDYTQSYTLPGGCDSTVLLHLTVNHATNLALSVDTCESYTWNGETYSISDTYTHEYTNADGCPSVDTLHLTINHSTTDIDEQTACESLTWIDGVTYTESTNTPTFTLTNAAGCDSVVTLHLTVNSPVHTAVTETACESFTWNGNTYTQSGDYPLTLTAANGCDSVVTLHLAINHAIATDEYLTICENELPYHYTNGQIDTIFDIGTPELLSINFYLLTESGCDSVVTLHLTITVGVDDYDGFDLKVYPNPASNVVNVQCTMNNVQFDDMELQLVDAYGRLLNVVETRHGTSLQTVQIDLSRYAAGIYFVKAVADGKTMAVRKVVKQ